MVSALTASVAISALGAIPVHPDSPATLTSKDPESPSTPPPASITAPASSAASAALDADSVDSVASRAMRQLTTGSWLHDAGVRTPKAQTDVYILACISSIYLAMCGVGTATVSLGWNAMTPQGMAGPFVRSNSGFLVLVPAFATGSVAMTAAAVFVGVDYSCGKPISTVALGASVFTGAIVLVGQGSLPSPPTPPPAPPTCPLPPALPPSSHPPYFLNPLFATARTYNPGVHSQSSLREQAAGDQGV